MSGPSTNAILPFLPGKLALAGNVIMDKPTSSPRTSTLLVRSRFMWDTPLFFRTIVVNAVATFHKLRVELNAKWVTDRSHLHHSSSSCDFSHLRRNGEQ